MNTDFEQSLRQAVKRLSKANFDQSIREVVEHYQDICNEALASGKSPEQSVQLANRRIGVIGDIARKIVDSPARIKKGKRLQILGATLWILAPFLSFITFWMLRDFAQNASTAPIWLTAITILFDARVMIIIGGLLVGFGAFRMIKLPIKSIAIGLAINVAIVGAFLGYSSLPGRTLDRARQLSTERIRQAKIEPTYLALENQLNACLASGKTTTIEDLQKLRETVTTQQLTGIQVSSHPQKYIYPASHQVGSQGQLYMIQLESTNSLEEARLRWWSAAGGLKQDMPQMTSARQTYFNELRSSYEFSLNPLKVGALSLFRSFYPFACAIGFAMVWMRIKLYRRDALKLRLTRN